MNVASRVGDSFVSTDTPTMPKAPRRRQSERIANRKCVVCHEDHKLSSYVTGAFRHKDGTKCDHKVCRLCFRLWHTSCPTCRAPVNLAQSWKTMACNMTCNTSVPLPTRFVLGKWFQGTCCESDLQLCVNEDGTCRLCVVVHDVGDVDIPEHLYNKVFKWFEEECKGKQWRVQCDDDSAGMYLVSLAPAYHTPDYVNEAVEGAAYKVTQCDHCIGM